MQSWHIAHGYEALTGERKPCWLEESGESMRLWPAFYSLLRSICQFYSLNQIVCGLAMAGSFTGRSNSFLPKRLSDSEALLRSADRTSFISDRERGSQSPCNTGNCGSDRKVDRLTFPWRNAHLYIVVTQVDCRPSSTSK